MNQRLACVLVIAAFSVHPVDGKFMKTHKFRLILDVEIDPQGVPPVDLKHNLHQVVRDAMNNGTLTGETPATVELYNYSVKEVRPRKKGRRCSISVSKNMRHMGNCKNLATHKVYNTGTSPFPVCRTHHKEFRRQYHTKPIKKGS